MTTRRSLSALLPLLPLLLSLASIQAQETSEKTVTQSTPAAAPAKPAAKPKKLSAAAKAKAEQQRALALSLLVSLSNEARAFRDQKLRARTLARIADGLWEVDPDQSRTLFQKAWEAAEVADQESARLAKEDREKQEAKGRGSVITRGPDLRSEVLRFAAKRDRALGEELLEKLKKDKAQEVADAVNAAKRDPFDLPDAMAQRLTLARQLLEADVPRALEFADPALLAITMRGLSFLSSLRDKDAAAADLRFMRMLGVAAADIQADANTVSLLSSYVFTPQLFITIDPKGSTNTSQMGRPSQPPSVTPELRSAFFRVAAQILMRPLAPPEQDQTTSGIEGKYLIIKRLLPLFDQYAPKPTAEMINGQLASLSAAVRDEIRKRDDESIRSGIRPEEEPADTEQSLLDRIGRAKTSAERDQLYVELTMRTMQRGEGRARDFVEKIEDMELRKQVRPYVDMSLVIHYIDKKKTEEADKLSHNGELTHFQKVWAFSQIARQLSDTDRDSALNLLTEATEEARRIDGSDADRPRALIGVANAYFTLDRNRSWELVTEAVKAANSVEGFSGEDSRLILRLQTPNMTSVRTSTTENFDVPSIFRTLTKDDYQRAEGLARNFEADSPRATALISIARAVLSESEN
ncbi:MAG TPA: hypothetical protein VMS31_02955 [Pyrinomonadaceae bacterium]|nr:hypothetical protein [Pyrinomonadaceae bacterium]